MPYWAVRAVAGTAIVIAQFLFAFNMWMTSRGVQPAYRAVPQPA